MKKWHWESIIINDEVRKLALPDIKRSLFHMSDKRMSTMKHTGLIACFRKIMSGYLKRDLRAN